MLSAAKTVSQIMFHSRHSFDSSSLAPVRLLPVVFKENDERLNSFQPCQNPGGAGKSYALKLAQAGIEKICGASSTQVVAFTGNAAAALGGPPSRSTAWEILLTMSP